MTNTFKAIETASMGLLNERFSKLAVIDRIRLMYQLFEKEEVLVTTSFGSNSAVLLKWISLVQPGQKVYFINTGFHFSETLAYRDQLVHEWNLNVEEVAPSKYLYELSYRQKLWETHPDTCCYLNKVMPLESLKDKHKVWMTGLVRHQTQHRSEMQIFEAAFPGEKIIRFNPLIDRTTEQIRHFFDAEKLPRHPLEERGYGSVGCQPCTTCAAGREGRWVGHAKTECGLHTGFHNPGISEITTEIQK